METITLEQALNHSDIAGNEIILELIKKRFKALRWTIRGKKDYIYLTSEVLLIRSKLRILRYEFTNKGKLKLETTHGDIKCYNPKYV